MASEAGGNIATHFQIEDPVKPVTVFTPNLAAASITLLFVAVIWRSSVG
jgi:hypothetical protein